MVMLGDQFRQSAEVSFAAISFMRYSDMLILASSFLCAQAGVVQLFKSLVVM